MRPKQMQDFLRIGTSVETDSEAVWIFYSCHVVVFYDYYSDGLLRQEGHDWARNSQVIREDKQ